MNEDGVGATRCRPRSRFVGRDLDRGDLCAYRLGVTSNERVCAVLATALIATGCATGITLTERGSRVTNVSQADAPFGCELMGDVGIGIPPDAARPRTEDQLVILMRNKAAEIGATHVVVDMSEQRTGNAGEIYYVGRGRAYACPEGHEATTPTEAPSAAQQHDDEQPADE